MCGDRAWVWGNNSGCRSAPAALTESRRAGGGQGEARLCPGGRNPTAGPGERPSCSPRAPDVPALAATLQPLRASSLGFFPSFQGHHGQWVGALGAHPDEPPLPDHIRKGLPSTTSVFTGPRSEGVGAARWGMDEALLGTRWWAVAASGALPHPPAPPVCTGDPSLRIKGWSGPESRGSCSPLTKGPSWLGPAQGTSQGTAVDRAAAEPELPRVDPVGQGLSGLPGPGVPSALLLLWTQGCRGRVGTLSPLGLQRRPLETAGCGGPFRPWPGEWELGGRSVVGPGGVGAFAVRRADGTQVLSLGPFLGPLRARGQCWVGVRTWWAGLWEVGEAGG